MTNPLLDALGLTYDVTEEANGVAVYSPHVTMAAVVNAARAAGVRAERDGLNGLVLFSGGDLVLCSWAFTPALCARAFVAAELIDSGSVARPDALPADVVASAAALLEYGCVDVDAEPLLSTAATLLLDRLPTGENVAAYNLADAFADGPAVIDMARTLLQR